MVVSSAFVVNGTGEVVLQRWGHEPATWGAGRATWKELEK